MHKLVLHLLAELVARSVTVHGSDKIQFAGLQEWRAFLASGLSFRRGLPLDLAEPLQGLLAKTAAGGGVEEQLRNFIVGGVGHC